MRLNPKLFTIPGEDAGFEVQEFDGRKIELFYMNDYEVILNDSLQKGKFSSWASLDGKNYRLFLERGFYEKLKPLYSQEINKIWVDFWDVAEGASKKYTRFGTLPIGVVALGLCIGASFMGDAGNYVALGGIFLAFIGMMLINRFLKKKIDSENVKSRSEIVRILGEEQFNELLTAQKEYIDNYYASLYPEDEEEVLEEAALDAPEEVEEATEEVIEEKVDEIKEDNEEVTE